MISERTAGYETGVTSLVSGGRWQSSDRRGRRNNEPVEYTFLRKCYGGWRMRVLVWRYWSLAGVIGLALGLIVQAAPANNAGASNKVIVYPGPGDSIDQLRQ